MKKTLDHISFMQVVESASSPSRWHFVADNINEDSEQLRLQDLPAAIVLDFGHL